MDEQEQGSSSLTLVMTDNYGGSDGEELQVFKSRGELEKFFVKVNKTRKPGIKPPEIDFEKNLAVVYCPGKTSQNTPVKLFSSDTGDEQITIRAQQAELTDNQESTAVLLPFGLYIMPLTDKEIVLLSDPRP